MIRVLGSTEGAEAEAAQELRRIMVEAWPWAESDTEVDIKIISGVQCHGQSVRDIDLVLLAMLPSKAAFKPFLSFSLSSGTLVQPERVHVSSLCLVIEVKDHDPSKIKFTGTRVDVRYYQGGRETWHSATDQNEKQKYSLKRYLEHNHVIAPYITNLIWLRNVLNVDLPRRPHNILGGNASWEFFLNVIIQLSPPRYRDGDWILEARLPDKPNALKDTVNVLTKALEPTHLDRSKMDRICSQSIDNEWFRMLGNKQVIFHGRGGTGKTIILLRLAWRAFQEQYARVLILTYNKALVADVRRIFTMLGLSDDIGQQTIQIQTVHSFLRSALEGLGILSKDDDFVANYESFKAEALTYIKSGTITHIDIENLIKERTDALSWDYIFIDEAQDWPESERDLLRYMYPPERFVIADGMDQLVRSEAGCDWHAGIPPRASNTVNLETCLRMKAALARFITELASSLGMSGWKAIPNLDAPGGRIIIITGNYFNNKGFHDNLMKYNEDDGNKPVDMLVCIPPQLVVKDEYSGEVKSMPAEILSTWGQQVWDGVANDVRASYPTSVNQLRVLQYDSCRGLEGWTVINLAMDAFYDYKKNSWRPLAENIPPGVYADDPDAAHRFAVRWLMIPLTRAIDTLVINIRDSDSPLGIAVKKAAEVCTESVDWYSFD